MRYGGYTVMGGSLRWTIHCTEGKQKKGTTFVIPLEKMGGDLLFHKQVQYHQRGRA